MPNSHSELSEVLGSLKPVFLDGDFTFVSIKLDIAADLTTVFQQFNNEIISLFREEEGISLLVNSAQITHGFENFQTFQTSSERFKLISLGTQTDLQLVGLTAAISTALASHSIPANVIAAFHRDYVAVPIDLAERAIEVIEQLKAKTT